VVSLKKQVHYIKQKIMSKKKKIFYFSIFISFLILIYPTIAVFDYLEWIETKKAIAAGGLPYQESGIVTMFQPACSEACLGKCCCAMCDGFCAGHNMVLFTSQSGSQSSLCYPVNMVVKGGGTVPIVGASIITGGTAPRGPMVKALAVPGSSVARVEKIINKFKELIQFN